MEIYRYKRKQSTVYLSCSVCVLFLSAKRDPCLYFLLWLPPYLPGINEVYLIVNIIFPTLHETQVHLTQKKEG